MMITLSFLLTHFVVQYPPSILEGMNGIMLQKERQRTEDARLVHRYHLLLQILQTQRILLIHQSLHHQYAVGGGLDALRLQLMNNLFCFHLFSFKINLEYLHFCAKRQSEDIPETGIAVAVESHEIDIIRTQLIEEREALHALAPVVRNLIRKPFAKSQIRADSGGFG